MNFRRAVAGVAAMAIALWGCASAPLSGRSQLTAPGPVSAAYSEFNMELSLVNVRTGPAAADAADAFEQRVARIGAELAAAAFGQFPVLRERFDRFEFIIADKAELGTVSSSSGRVAVMRPVSSIAYSDAVLAFILAREIGHVIANHHAEDTAASLAVSGVALILFPLAGIANALGGLFIPGGTAAAAGSATSLTANVASTAASFVGSRLVILSYRSSQLDEADGIALGLVYRVGYSGTAISAGFAGAGFPAEQTEWVRALTASIRRLPAGDPWFD